MTQNLDLHLDETVFPDCNKGGCAILAVVHEDHPVSVSKCHTSSEIEIAGCVWDREGRGKHTFHRDP